MTVYTEREYRTLCIYTVMLLKLCMYYIGNIVAYESQRGFSEGIEDIQKLCGFVEASMYVLH